MKNVLKKLGHALWSKAVLTATVRSSGSYTVFDGSGDTVVFCAVESSGNRLTAIIIALCGALGYEMSSSGADRIACLFPGVSGCERVEGAK